MTCDAKPRTSDHGLGLLLVALVAVPPLLWERRPVEPVGGYASEAAALASQLAVAGLMAAAVAWRARADRALEPRPALLHLGLVLLAGLLTKWHWHAVDAVYPDWQLDNYLGVLNHTYSPPHRYRPLPYGFVRALERVTGDWKFAGLAYRWFFLYWFVWAYHRFARLFLPPAGALVALLVLPVLYPFSIQQGYCGQPTDPMSHALFALALVCVVEDRWLALAAALALGVAAKETVVLVVPAYWACYWRRGWGAIGRTAVLGAACVAAFLAVRLPVQGWEAGNHQLNGLDALMLGTNLGFGEPIAHSGLHPAEMYFHLLVFTVPFLVPIALGWRRLDYRLIALAVVLVPTLLFTNLCFGWIYESRNYVPLLPLLATMAVLAVWPPAGGKEAESWAAA